MFTARDPPPAVVYLDCEQTSADNFSLKWSLPQTGGVPISHSVLEVKDASGEWKPVDGPFDGQSFTFYGKDYFSCSGSGARVCTVCSPEKYVSLRDSTGVKSSKFRSLPYLFKDK